MPPKRRDKGIRSSYVGLTNVFPVYIGRENKVESLEERINGCFERSMNGRAIPENSKEMRAIVTYIKTSVSIQSIKED
ncbi:c-type cytochrome [Sphingobacterium sp. E70]|uniref:c-type cytochrome n=1 Tax=Sphingobacterium sp. E70 TaxID=2853439 RepID=UPI00359C7AA9